MAQPARSGSAPYNPQARYQKRERNAIPIIDPRTGRIRNISEDSRRESTVTMATSKQEDTSKPTPDLLICPVCLENMVDRQPRSLTCLHTFCQSCLEQCEIKVYNRCLECPLCKAETRLPREGVKKLPLDFKLKQFSEILQEPTNSIDNCGICLFKKKKAQAHWFCKDCEQPLCKHCESLHNKTFEKHVIIPRDGTSLFCEAHSARMKYYCPECEVCLCPVCMMTQNHSRHRERPVPIHKADQAVKRTVSMYVGKFEDLQKTLESDVKEKVGIKDSLDGIAKQISEKGSEQKKLIDDRVNTLTNDLNSNYRSKVEKSIDTRQVLMTSTQEMVEKLKKTSVKEMLSSLSYFQKKIKSCQEDVNVLRKENQKHEVPVFKPAQQSPHTIGTLGKAEEKQAVVISGFCIVDSHADSFYDDISDRWSGSEDEYNWLDPAPCPCLSSHYEPARKALHLTEADVEMKWPKDIAILDDKSIVFSDSLLGHLTRLDEQGKLIRTYTPIKAANKIKCMSLSGDTVYMLHKDHLSTFYQDDRVPQIYTRPVGYLDCEILCSLSVGENGDIYSGNVMGQVYKNRGGTVHRRQVNYIGEQHDAYVSIADVNGMEILVVCDATGDRVFFNDARSGRRIARIEGQFNFPCGAVGTTRDTILVVDRDNHRLVECTLGGEVLGSRLGRDNGLFYPVGVAYKHPYLWVTECRPSEDHSCIKMFKYQ